MPSTMPSTIAQPPYADLLASLRVSTFLLSLHADALRTSLQRQTLPPSDATTLREACLALGELAPLVFQTSSSTPSSSPSTSGGTSRSRSNNTAATMLMMESLSLASPSSPPQTTQPTTTAGPSSPPSGVDVLHHHYHHYHRYLPALLPSLPTVASLPDGVVIKIFFFLSGGGSTEKQEEEEDEDGREGGREGGREDDAHIVSQRHIREQFGCLREVSSRWASLAAVDELWAPIVVALWPVLRRREGGRGGGRGSLFSTSFKSFHSLAGGQRSYHGVCAYRGRTLVEPGVLICTPRWPARYRLRFDMHDQRDGLSLFSGEGPLVYQEWHNQHEHRTILRLGAGSSVVTTPFSAASRCRGRVGEEEGGEAAAGVAAGGGGVSEIRQYFQRSSTHGLCIRVTAIEQRTGREALIYESSARTDRHCQDAAQGWPVPPHSLAVTDHAGTWTCAKGSGAASIPPMRSLFDFTIVPVGFTTSAAAEGGREGAVAGERLYEVHSAQIDPPTNTITHKGIVGLVFLGHVHEVGLLLASLKWV